ncbi:MAG: isoamylase early set domain-containing protein [Bacteroidales bacterium]|nr:isoamylase early set domain-containing protein [Bacteroidales bacterium]
MKSKPECKVTFRLSKKEVGDVKKVAILGSFTNWQEKPVEMSKLKNGEFSAVITLPSDGSFEYRYLIDDIQWMNDPEADAYTINEFGGENSIISTNNN